MNIADALQTPGEHALMLEGLVGPLEAKLLVPPDARADSVAFLGHPHSLQGGTMQNKVVTTMAKMFAELHIPSLRFNFRGVGLSVGEYDAGIGESEDMIAQVKAWPKMGPLQYFFAGFSFGSYVTYRTACAFARSRLITIAPSVEHYDYSQPADLDFWLIVQGEADEIVPCESVIAFANRVVPAIPVIRFPDTGHFFHGQLIPLKNQLLDFVRAQDPLL